MHDKDCSRFADVEGRGTPPGWEAHLAECPDCQAQARIAEELRAALGAIPVPPPAAGFEARLHRRLENAAPQRSRRIMAAYWMAAGAASLAVLYRLDWPRILDAGGLWAGLALAATGPLVAIAAGRRLRALPRLMLPGASR